MMLYTIPRKESSSENFIPPREELDSSSTLESNHSFPLSWSLYPWVAMILSIIMWVPFGDGASSAGLGNTSNVYRMFFVVTAGIIAPLLVLKEVKHTGRVWNAPLVLLLIYGLVAFFSSIYVPANAFYTMWKALEIIVDVLAMIAILSSMQGMRGPLAAYRYLILVLTIILLFVVVGAVISPHEGFRPSSGVLPIMLQGYFPIVNPNSVGFISVLVFLHNVAVYSRASSRLRRFAAVVLSTIAFGTLILAQSRTSIASFAVGLVIYLYLNRKRGFAIFIVGSSVVTVLLGASVSEIVVGYLGRGQSTELLTSLSGRTRGWEMAWEMFQQSPYFGHGFAAAARTEILGGGQQASTLHGAVFDVIVGVGLVGLFPWTMAIVLTLSTMLFLTRSVGKHITSRSEISLHAEFVAITATLIIKTVTSSSLAMHEHAFMLFLCIVAYVYTLKRQVKYGPEEETGRY